MHYPENTVQNGYILLPVILALTILAVLSYQLTTESALNVGSAVRNQEMQTAKYVAEAGLQHAIWLINQTNCNNYSDLIDQSFGDHHYTINFINALGNPVMSGSPVTIKSTALLANGFSSTITLKNKDCEAPVNFCDANFIATNKINEFSTSDYSSMSIKGLTFLPEGKIFKGITSPPNGAWISVDSSSDEIHMTDLNGSLLISNSTPGSSPTGISFINFGTYTDHLIISDYFSHSITFVDLNGNVITTVDTGSFGATNPVDIAFIDTSASRTYDGMIAILNVDGIIFIIDQSGNLQTIIDVSGITSQAEGIVHLPGKDLLMLADNGTDKVLIIDFNGNQINSYSTTPFGSNAPYAITINPVTCAHVIGDLGIDKIITVDNSGSNGEPCNGNFRDEFNSQNYSGNDGTLTWAGDWQEVGESDGPTSGDERVKNDQNDFQLRVRDNNNNGEGVEREADLSGATSATLAFDYRLSGLDNSSDYVNVEISTNGSAGPWSELAQFSGPGDDASYSNFNIDISNFISSNTSIRFISSPNMGNTDTVWFDNVEIQCNP